MSLVTTASEYVVLSARQSAATRAVFPLPTGPPMPTRTGPPLRAARRPNPAKPSSSGCLRCKETHLPSAVVFCRDVQSRRAERRQFADRAERRSDGGVGGVLDVWSEGGEDGGDRVGVDA